MNCGFGEVLRRLLSRIEASKVIATRRSNDKHLMVDVSVIARHDARTGIQRVVRAIWTHMEMSDPSNVRVVPICARDGGYFYAETDFLERVGDGARGRPVVPQAGDIFLGLDLAAHILPRHERLFRRWKKAGVSIHLVVYDLLPAHGAGWFRRRTRINFLRWLRFLSRQADGAICISATVARQLSEWLAVHAGCRAQHIKISTISLGGDILSSRPSAGIPTDAAHLMAEMRTADIILMVGTVEPRKGYLQALTAFEHLWNTAPDEAPRLVIVGKPGWKTEQLQLKIRSHSENGNRLLWLEEVSDEFLERLYLAATGVLLTSHAEGCGLPILEALTYRKPVLARDLPVFREVQHPSLFFFNNDEPLALAGAIKAFATHARVAADEHTVSVLPRWSDTTAQLFAVLELQDASEGERRLECREADGK